MEKKVTQLALGLIMLSIFAGCANMSPNQQQGTAIGSGVGAGMGALLGQAIGKNTDSTVVGAGIGALVGGIAGNQIGQYMDYQEQSLRGAIAASEGAQLSRNRDILTATFRGETFFHHNSSQLLPGGYAEVARVAGVLNRYNQTSIEVRGHTDATGPDYYNMELSRRRAEAVKNALIENGVAPQRISAVGYGESRPISSSHAMNRRVEIVINPTTA